MSVDLVQKPSPAHEHGFAGTSRKDKWWLAPLLTGLGLGTFIIYSTCRAFQNGFYHVGPETGILENHSYLLSPFYSPLLTGLIPDSMTWISPAFLILWAPGGFRLTCYYYRKAYYRAFFLDPVACAVGEPGSFCGIKREKGYKGETRVLLFQNLHRFFLYVALVFLVLLAIDAVHACLWPDGSGGLKFGVSIGTLVLFLNTTLLTLYTFSCHSLRHLVGGRVNCFSRAVAGEARFKAWSFVSMLNRHHMLFAWISLFGVGFADFYVWMVASVRNTDRRLF
jgi:hypothetical protein